MRRYLSKPFAATFAHEAPPVPLPDASPSVPPAPPAASSPFAPPAPAAPPSVHSDPAAVDDNASAAAPHRPTVAVAEAPTVPDADDCFGANLPLTSSSSHATHSCTDHSRSSAPRSQHHTPDAMPSPVVVQPPSSARDASSISPPTSPPRSYLPTVTVPSLPSVRKYLFSSTTPAASSSEPRHRRTSSASSDRFDSPKRANDPSYAALPELARMADRAFGPVGHMTDTLAKRLPHDRLLGALNNSAQERNRILMQFLRARHHNASEALAMITSALRWRSSVDIQTYLNNPAKLMATPTACFPMHIISAPESCKQPVVYGLIRLLDKKADRAAFHDALLSFLEASYFGDTYVEDEMVIILDFRGWSIRRNAPYRLVKDGIQTLQDYYPERLGPVFLVNYPTSIRAAYTAISPIIDAGAKEKIVWIPDDDPSTILKKFVSPKSIPFFLGGEMQATFPPTWPDVATEFATTR